MAGRWGCRWQDREQPTHEERGRGPALAGQRRASGDHTDMRRLLLFIATCPVLLAIAASGSRIHAAQASGTVRGVYSEAQRLRGEKAYMASCAGCHGATLTGRASLTNGVPPLTGDD